MLISGFDAKGLPYKVVNLSNNDNTRIIGSFAFQKAVKILSSVLSIWANMPFIQNVYLLVAISPLGFIRDCLIIWPAYLLNKRITIHVQSGGYGIFFEKQNWLVKRIIISTLSKVTKIVVLGNLLIEQFSFLPGYLSKIEVVYNGLSLGLDHTQDSPKTVQDVKTINLLYLSNMILSKGYFDLLDACRILVHKHGLPIKCDFCGDFLTTITDNSNLVMRIIKMNF